MSAATNSCKALGNDYVISVCGCHDYTPSGDPAVLLFSHDSSIFGVNLLNLTKSLYVLRSDLRGVFTFDFDYKHQRVRVAKGKMCVANCCNRTCLLPSYMCRALHIICVVYSNVNYFILLKSAKYLSALNVS